MAIGKKSNLDSGFLLLYDWLPAFSALNADETKQLLFALIDRQRNGAPFPAFNSELVNIFAKMIEPTIERRLQGQDGGNKAQSTTQDTTVGTIQDTTVGTTQDTTVDTIQDTTVGTTQDTTVGTTQDTTVGTIQDTTVGTTQPSRAEIRRAKHSTSAEKKYETEHRFNTFWDRYPLKVGKEVAHKAFEKVHPNDALLTTILNALEKHKKSERWVANNGQYIPNPSTWLNQKRWEDELPEKAMSDAQNAPDYSDAERYSNIKIE